MKLDLGMVQLAQSLPVALLDRLERLQDDRDALIYAYTASFATDRRPSNLRSGSQMLGSLPW
jgi:hypothetical protein